MRIKVNIGIKQLLETIKPEIIAAECGIPYKTFMAKAKGQVVNGAPLYFFERDLEKINSVLPAISKRLNNIVVEYTMPNGIDCTTKGKSLKSLKEIFQLKYFYTKLGKDTKWFSKRMLDYKVGEKNYYFTEGEIFTINLAVKEAATMLSSIELV